MNIQPNKQSLLWSTAISIGISTLLTAIFTLVYPNFQPTLLSFIGITFLTWLSYENGGNDVSRGIAPLVATNKVSLNRALTFGTLVTFAGSIFSIYFAVKIYKLFLSGILNTSQDISLLLVCAIVFGAAMWVTIATKLSLPVSTTHSMIGAMVMSGFIAFGVAGVLWGNLISLVILPLLFSPLIGFVLGWLITSGLKPIYINKKFELLSTWIFAGVICFVRAVNDTPKLVGIAVLIAYITVEGLSLSLAIPYFILVAVAMAVGSYIKGKPVTETLARKVARLDCKTSLSAAISGASLILLASKLGLPVSTTHVTTSALVGSGTALDPRALNFPVIRDIFYSWIITLPASGILAALAYFLLQFFS